MGDPKFARKHYSTPPHPWDGTRISEEKMIVHKYGLKNKRELWKTQTVLRDIRHQARELQARLRTEDEQAVKEIEALIERLKRLGLLHGNAELNDVLALEVEALLTRRLQTQIYLKGLARTVKQARQLIVHGHIAVDGRKVTVPSYLVKDTEAALIEYYRSSPMLSDLHPERPAADFKPEMTSVKDERRVAADRERDMRRSREIERIAAMRRAIQGAIDDETVAEDAETKDIIEVNAEEGETKEGAKEGEAPADGEKKPEGKSPEKPEEKPADKPEEKPEKKAEKKAEGGES